MPITTIIDRERNITIERAVGKLTFDEIAKTLEGFYGNNDAPENVLWDGREASLVDLSHDELKQLAVYSKKFKKLGTAMHGGKRALLAPTNVDFGLARIINSFKDTLADDVPFEVRTFRTYEEAIEWLTE